MHEKNFAKIYHNFIFSIQNICRDFLTGRRSRLPIGVSRLHLKTRKEVKCVTNCLIVIRPFMQWVVWIRGIWPIDPEHLQGDVVIILSDQKLDQ